MIFAFAVLSMVLSGGCAFFIYLVTSSTANLLLSCAFGFVSTMGFNALDCLGIELFPTNVRYVYCNALHYYSKRKAMQF